MRGIDRDSDYYVHTYVLTYVCIHLLNTEVYMYVCHRFCVNYFIFSLFAVKQFVLLYLCTIMNVTISKYLFVFFLLPLSASLRLIGHWTNGDFITILTRFGFQKTDSMNLDHTRGFIYGNITLSSQHQDIGQQVLLLLVNRAHFRPFYTLWQAGNTCSKLMEELSTLGYDKKCLPNGKNDLFRWVPCKNGQLCPDEDNPDNVLPNYQFTYRIQEKNVPGFWYLALVSCKFDSHCNWTEQSHLVSVSYDLWLVNGNPGVKYTNPFEHQFSFDEQDTAEIYLAALVLFFIIALLQWRSVKLNKRSGIVPTRSWLLTCICTLETSAIVFNIIHILVFSFDGWGLLAFRWIGDIIWLVAVELQILTIILLARGWTIVEREIYRPKMVFALWATGAGLHLLFFVWNSHAVDELEEIDIFQTWPGWGIMFLRVLLTLWFLLELRETVRKCDRAYKMDKMEFMIHFGAGFLVWFVYLPILGIVASQMSLLWRFKIILGIIYLADFLASATLVHLLWPRSTNRRFFMDMELRQLTTLPQDDLEDFEKALVNEEVIPIDPTADDLVNPN